MGNHVSHFRDNLFKFSATRSFRALETGCRVSRNASTSSDDHKPLNPLGRGQRRFKGNAPSEGRSKDNEMIRSISQSLLHTISHPALVRHN